MKEVIAVISLVTFANRPAPNSWRGSAPLLIPRSVRRLPSCFEEFVYRQPDVPGDLPQQRGRDIAASMEGNRGPPAVGGPILTMRAALSYQLEPELPQQLLDFLGLQDGDGAQWLGDLDRVGADEFGLEPGLAVLKEHLHDLLQVGQQLVDRGPLGVRSRPAGHVADVESSVGIPFNNGSVGPHWRSGMVSDCLRIRHDGGLR